MSDPFAIFNYWVVYYTVTTAAATTTLVATIHVFFSTPKRMRWTTPFNLALLLLGFSLAVFICYLLLIYYASPSASGKKTALRYILAIVANLQFLVAEFSLTWMVRRIYPRRKFLKMIPFIALCISLRFGVQLWASIVLISGQPPWVLSAINQILMMTNCILFSGLFIFRYRHKLRDARNPNQFYQTILNLSIRNALIPTIIVIPTVVTNLIGHSPGVLLANGILTVTFRFVLGFVISDSLYRLNLGDSSDSRNRRMADLSASGRINSFRFTTINLTNSFGVERRSEKILENFLLEAYEIAGGTKGYVAERNQNGQVRVRCGFDYHTVDEEVRVSIYPVEDPIKQAEIPYPVLQYGLDNGQISVIRFDDDDMDEDLRVYFGDHVCNLSSALFLPVTTFESPKQRLIYIENEATNDMRSERSIDLQILTFLTQQLVANVDNVKLFSKLMLLNQSLEKKVLERTSELQQRNVELERAKAEAVEAASTKAMFLSNMSHEIRTPISQVVLAAELLSTVDLPPDGSEYLNIIIHCGKLLLSLVNDVLDLSKLETGNVTLEFIEFDLYELIQISMDAFTVENDVKVGYYMEKDVPRIVIGDVTRLRQIITNLVSNAIKFTRSGYVFLCVCSDQVNENEFDVEFNVIDTGCGISPQFMSKIFDRYAQEDESITRKFGGTGLGLPICQDLCKLMGSQINIKSEVNHGSTFSFTIRFSRPDSPPQPSQFFHALDQTLKIVILENPIYLYKSKTILSYQIETMGADRDCYPISQHHEIDFELYDLLIVDVTTMQDPEGDLIDVIQRCYIPVILIHSASHFELANQIYHKFSSGIHRTAIYKLLHPYKQSSLFKVVSSLVKTHDLPSSADEPSGDSTIISQGFEERVEEIKDRSDHPESEPGRINILLVEDNEINQKIMQMMLMKLGFSADIACNGQVAVEMAESKHYDLILMDVRIPVLNGLEATRQIREHCRDSEIAFGSESPVSNPYIVGLRQVVPNDSLQSWIRNLRYQFLSANVSPEHEIEGLRAGMDLYLSKPISRSTLSEIISNVQEGPAPRSDIGL